MCADPGSAPAAFAVSGKFTNPVQMGACRRRQPQSAPVSRAVPRQLSVAASGPQGSPEAATPSFHWPATPSSSQSSPPQTIGVRAADARGAMPVSKTMAVFSALGQMLDEEDSPNGSADQIGDGVSHDEPCTPTYSDRIHAGGARCRVPAFAEQVGSASFLWCTLCGIHMKPMLNQGEAMAKQLVIDERPVCRDCYALFECSDYVPRYNICINPLCRQKWKQLGPKSLSLFCLSCKKKLEEVALQGAYTLQAQHVEQMYECWYRIAMELSEVLGYPTPCPLQVTENTRSSVIEARSRWRCLLVAFHNSLPPAPAADEVCNWKSVHSRCLYYRGVVHRMNRRFICMLEAKAELDNKFKEKRKVAEAKEFAVLDWHDNLEDGSEVIFTATSNPCSAERKHVSKIVRVLQVLETVGKPEPSAPSHRSIGVQAEPPQSVCTSGKSFADTYFPRRPSHVQAERPRNVLGSCKSCTSMTTIASPSPSTYLAADETENDQWTCSIASGDTAFADLMEWSMENPDSNSFSDFVQWALDNS